MSAELIRGSEVAKAIAEVTRQRVARVAELRGTAPGLAVILVGEDPASRSYVAGKRKQCQQLGIRALDHDLPAGTPEADLLSLIDRLNRDSAVDGILVQSPLPGQIDEAKVLEGLDPDKDVDGFHPENLGRLMLGRPTFIPCTPYGVQQLLVRSGVAVAGKQVVVVGRSHLVGKPLANLLLNKGPGADATVTVCHSRTADLAAHTRRAVIMVAALGKPKAITAEMVKTGAVVIDVGVNRIGTSPSGKALLCGDVDFEAVKEKASKITPVPGGVGPMTIAMLMQNTVLAAERTLRIASSV
jgi:methylenetetrahydrofolate dehydrogenase (NADP+)/methenyltetrahydrofolate cyclohydrolase